jgi:hypothetical protein
MIPIAKNANDRTDRMIAPRGKTRSTCVRAAATMAVTAEASTFAQYVRRPQHAVVLHRRTKRMADVAAAANPTRWRANPDASWSSDARTGVFGRSEDVRAPETG